jgi:ribonuclease HII
LKPDSFITDYYEKTYWADNLFAAGVDEAGRGCLAGPVVSAAVIFPVNYYNEIYINDSKKMKPKEREDAFPEIFKNAVSIGIGIVENEIIDNINILNATYQAMNMAVNNLKIKPAHLLVDGNRFKGSDIPFTTVTGGDAKCISIAAASIIAKVTRDRIMTDYAEKKYPGYFFSKHKGYGTKLHYARINVLGISDYHRKTFLTKLHPYSFTIFD